MSSSEQIGPMFIFVVFFILIGGGLVGMINTNVVPGDVMRTADLSIQGIEVSYFTPTSGRVITSANVTNNYVGLPNSKAIKFYEPNNNDPFSVCVVRNSVNYPYGWFVPAEWCKYPDFIAIEQHNWPFVDRYALSLSAIVKAHNESFSSYDKVVMPIVGFDKPAYVIVIQASSAANFNSDIYNNNYKIYIGLRIDPGAPSTQSGWWTTLWSVLTGIVAILTGAAIPSVPVLSWLISAFVWSLLIFLTYEFVTRSYGGG